MPPFRQACWSTTINIPRECSQPKAGRWAGNQEKKHTSTALFPLPSDMLLGLPIDRTRRKVTPRMQFIPVNLLGPKGGKAKDKHHSWRQKIICAFTLIKVPGPFYCDCNSQTALLEIFGLLKACGTGHLYGPRQIIPPPQACFFIWKKKKIIANFCHMSITFHTVFWEF